MELLCRFSNIIQDTGVVIMMIWWWWLWRIVFQLIGKWKSSTENNTLSQQFGLSTFMVTVIIPWISKGLRADPFIKTRARPGRNIRNEFENQGACICKRQSQSSFSIKLFLVLCNYQMQLGHTLWRKEKCSITCVIFCASRKTE